MNRVDWVRHYVFTRGRTHRYGADRSQLGDLHVPHGDGRHPVIVLIHGGSWRKKYGRAVMRAVAAALAQRGFAVWNIEYRRVGNGGGWPQTFADVAAAIDRLDGLDPSLDLDRVDVLGHSADHPVRGGAEPVRPARADQVDVAADAAGGHDDRGGVQLELAAPAARALRSASSSCTPPRSS